MTAAPPGTVLRAGPRPSVRARPAAGRVASAGRGPALALLVLALVAGVGARIAGLEGKHVLTHDESISYLAATCHQGEYARALADGSAPVGRWVPAATWQRFLEPDGRWCFGTIRADLAAWDIHPPGYFWLLHAWTHAFGATLTSGAAMGIVIDVLTCLALFGFAAFVLRRRTAAAAVAATWMLSSAVVPIATEARQYVLLGLASTLLGWAALRVAEHGPGARRLLALGAATCLGMLTHYQFAVAVAGAGLLLLPALLRGPRVTALAGAAAMLAGLVVAALLVPGFLSSFHRERDQAGAVHLGERLTGTARSLANFVLPGALLPTALAAVLALALVALAVAVTVRARRAGDRRALRVMTLLGCNAGCVCLLYLAGMSHGQAMGGKYLAAVWPFAAFLPVLALRGLPAAWLRRIVPAGAVAAAALALVAGFTFYPRASPPRALASAGGAVVDITRRGELPRLASLLPPRTPVLAASQAQLARLRMRPPRAPLVYLGIPAAPNSPAGEARVLAHARPGWRVVGSDRGLWDAFDLWVLEPAAGQPNTGKRLRRASASIPCWMRWRTSRYLRLT